MKIKNIVFSYAVLGDPIKFPEKLKEVIESLQKQDIKIYFVSKWKNSEEMASNFDRVRLVMDSCKNVHIYGANYTIPTDFYANINNTSEEIKVVLSLGVAPMETLWVCENKNPGLDQIITANFHPVPLPESKAWRNPTAAYLTMLPKLINSPHKINVILKNCNHNAEHFTVLGSHFLELYEGFSADKIIKNVVFGFDKVLFGPRDSYGDKGIWFPEQLQTALQNLKNSEINCYIITSTGKAAEITSFLKKTQISSEIINHVKILGSDTVMPSLSLGWTGPWEAGLIKAHDLGLKPNETIWLDSHEMVDSIKKAGFYTVMVPEQFVNKILKPLSPAYLTALPTLIETPNSIENSYKYYNGSMSDSNMKDLEIFLQGLSKEGMTASSINESQLAQQSEEPTTEDKSCTLI